MKTALFLTIAGALLAASGPASAQDGGKAATTTKPTPAPAAPAAKRERKSSPQAEAVLKRYASLLHFPSAAYRTLSMQTHCTVESLGGEIGCKFVTSEKGDLTLDVQLPETLRSSGSPEQLAMIRAGMSNKVSQFFKPVLVPPELMAQQYDVSTHEEKGETVVEMKRFSDAAAWESLTLFFDKEGLLRRQVGTPRVDPNDPLSAMDAGADVELTLEYRKRGERYTIESGRILKPMGEGTLKIAYYEIDGQAPLPRELTFTDPMLGGQPVVISIHDFVLNGTPVPATARKDEKKAPAPAPAKPSAAPPAPR